MQRCKPLQIEYEINRKEEKQKKQKKKPQFEKSKRGHKTTAINAL